MTYLLSLGGSLVVPDKGIDISFLRRLKNLLSEEIRLGNKFIIVVGGGTTARHYIDAAARIGKVSLTDQDWLGIHATRLNGHLLRTVLADLAHPEIITNPLKKIITGKPIIIATGYRPGWSTDYVAVLLARQYGLKKVLNLSNIDYVYSRDPRKFPSAVPVKEMTWPDLLRIVGAKWKPGLNAPFDPVAAKLASQLKLEVAIINGRKLANLKRLFSGQSFKGTIIK